MFSFLKYVNPWLRVIEDEENLRLVYIHRSAINDFISYMVYIYLIVMLFHKLGCIHGATYDPASMKCVPCPLGTYEFVNGTICIPCPEGTTTLQVASIHRSQCVEDEKLHIFSDFHQNYHSIVAMQYVSILSYLIFGLHESFLCHGRKTSLLTNLQELN